MNLIDLVTSFGHLWLLVTIAAGLTVVWQLLGGSLAKVVALFLTGVVSFMIVGSWVWPDYVQAPLPVHWGITLLIWMYAAWHAGSAGGAK